MKRGAFAISIVLAGLFLLSGIFADRTRAAQSILTPSNISYTVTTGVFSSFTQTTPVSNADSNDGSYWVLMCVDSNVLSDATVSVDVEYDLSALGIVGSDITSLTTEAEMYLTGSSGQVPTTDTSEMTYVYDFYVQVWNGSTWENIGTPFVEENLSSQWRDNSPATLWDNTTDTNPERPLTRIKNSSFIDGHIDGSNILKVRYNMPVTMYTGAWDLNVLFDYLSITVDYTEGDPEAPSDPVITGPTAGEVDTEYSFGFEGTDIVWLEDDHESDGSSRDYRDFIYDGTNYIAAGRLWTAVDGEDAKLWASTDAVNWTQYDVEGGSGNQIIQSIIFDGSAYVAAGTEAGDATVWYATSLSGPWTNLTLEEAAGWFENITYGGGKYVVSGYMNNTDTDATIWESSAYNSGWVKRDVDTRTGTQNINAVAYGNSKYVAAGYHHNGTDSDAVIWESTDLVNWTVRELNAGSGHQRAESIIYADGKFVAVGYVSTGASGETVVWESSDGTNWTERSVDTGYYSQLFSIGYDGTNFVIPSRDSWKPIVWMSDGSDLSTWTQYQLSEEDRNAETVIHDGSQYVVMGSDDGEFWDGAFIWTASTLSAQVRYGVDWDMDDSVDEWVPSSGYVLSGEQSTTTHQWNTGGVKTFQALTDDDESKQSNWVQHSVDVFINAPKDLRVRKTLEGTLYENPTGFNYATPFFSAIYEYGDVDYYQIQLTTADDASYASVVWDTGKSDYDFSTCTANTRCDDVFYSSPAPYSDVPFLSPGADYIWRMKVWNTSDEESEWSDSATIGMDSYPLQARIYTGSETGTGDGYVPFDINMSWDLVHDYEWGSTPRWGELPSQQGYDYAYIGADYYTGGGYQRVGIDRAFFPIDTSTLPEVDIISATFNLHVNDIYDQDDDGYDWVGIVQTNQATTSSLDSYDYNDCGAVDNPTEGSERIDISDMTAGQYHSWNLNSTGILWVSTTGWTKLGAREGHDMLDTRPDLETHTNIQVSTAEADMDERPYLEVVYAESFETQVIPEKPQVTGPESGYDDVGYEFGFVSPENDRVLSSDVDGQRGYEIIHNKDEYVVVGTKDGTTNTDAYAWRSKDLITWEEYLIDDSLWGQWAQEITFDGSKYAVLGEVYNPGNVLAVWTASSDDLSNWTRYDIPYQASYDFQFHGDLIYDFVNGRYIVLASGARNDDFTKHDILVWESTDLSSWTLHVIDSSVTYDDYPATIVFNETTGDYSVTGYRGGTPYVWVSSDLSSWTRNAMGGTGVPMSHIYDSVNDVYVAVGRGSTPNWSLWESNDLSTWIYSAISASEGAQYADDIIYDDASQQYAVVVNDRGGVESTSRLWTSSDLQNWTEHIFDESLSELRMYSLVEVSGVYTGCGYKDNGTDFDSCIWRIPAVVKDIHYGIDWDMSGGGELTLLNADDQGGTTRGVWGDGRFVYVANNGLGLQVYSVSGSGDFILLDTDNTVNYAQDVWGDGRFVYVADNSTGLHTYSVNNSGGLTHIDSHNPGGGYGWGVWGDGRFVYLAFGASGLHSYSVDADGTLTHIDANDQGGNAYDIWGDDTYVYMADGNYNGLRSYTVDASGMITYVDQGYNGGLGGYGVWADGDYVYLADGNNGVRVYLVDGVGDIYLVDTDDQGEYARDVYGDGRFIYVANMDGGILTYEVADNGVLTFIDSHDPDPTGWAEGVWADGKFAYLADATGGLFSYSVADGVDQWVPSSGYSVLGVQASTTHLWTTLGIHYFRVTTEDESGYMSPWTLGEFFAAQSNTAPTTPVLDDAPVEALANQSVEFSFVSEDTQSFIRHTVEKNLEQAYINDLAYDTLTSQYIAIGTDYTNSGAALWTSSNLDGWKRQDIATSASVYKIIQNGSTYVAGGNMGGDAVVWESTDLVSWTSHIVDNSAGSQWVRTGLYDSVGNRYVVAGWDSNTDSAMVWESTDLVSWTSHIVGTGTLMVGISDIAYDSVNTQFVVSGVDDTVGSIWVSDGADLSTWTQQVFADAGWINSITIHDGTYILGGSNDYGNMFDDATVWTSTNLSSWTDHRLKDNNGSDVADVVVNPTTGEYLAVGYWNDQHAMVWSSIDLVNWEEQEMLSAVTDRRQIEAALFSTDTGEFVVGGFERQYEGWMLYNVAVWSATGLIDRVQYGIDWDASGGGDLAFIDSDYQGGYGYNVWGDGGYIYAADLSEGLMSYSVDASGNITFIDSDEYGPGVGEDAVDVWGDGDYVYVANRLAGLVSYSVDAAGNLTFIDSDDQTGSVEGVWGDGDYIYAADLSEGLMSYSVDASGNLTFIDSDYQGGFGQGVWGDGDYVYLANHSAGIATYSVDAAGNLTFIDSDYQGGYGYGVWGDGDYIYLASMSEGLMSYSVDASGNLTFIDSDDQGGSAYSVWGDGEYVYLANDSAGIATYSVDASGNLTFISSDDQGGRAYGVWGDGDYVYLANHSAGIFTYSVEDGVDQWLSETAAGATTSVSHSWSSDGEKTFRIVARDDDGAKSGWTQHSITIGIRQSPTKPTVSGQTIGSPDTLYTFNFDSTDPSGDNLRYGIDWDGVGGGSITLSEEHDDYLGIAMDSVFDGSYLYTAMYSGVRAHSIGVSGELETVDYVPSPYYYLTSVWSNGTYVYTGNRSSSSNGYIYSFSIGAGGELTEVWNLHLPSGTVAGDMWDDGTFLYMTGGGQVYSYIMNAGGSLSTGSTTNSGSATGVWGDGTYVYVADTAAGILSYSVDGSGNFTLLDSHNPGGGTDVWGDGTYVYIAGGNSGVHSYSVDGSGNLTYIDTYISGDYVYDVWGDGNYVYTANSSGGIMSYSVDGSGNLTSVDTESTIDSARSIVGDGTFVVLADYYGGIHSYSVDGSGYFAEVDIDNKTGSATGVWGDGKFIYVANGGSGLYSFYFSEVEGLVYADSVNTTSYAYKVWGDNGYVYVAANTGGVRSYSVNNIGELSYVDAESVGQAIRSVWGNGNVLFTADYSDGIRSYLLDGAGGMTYVDSHDPGGTFNNVWAEDGYVYLAGYDLDVYGFDGSGNLNHLAEYDTVTQAKSVVGDDRFIYAGTDNSGLKVYEKGEAGSLTYIGVTGGWYYDSIWHDGKFLYAGGRDCGDLHVFRVSDAGSLTEVDFDGCSNYRSIWGDGNYVYTANSMDGLLRYSISSQVDEWVPTDVPVDQYVASGVQQSTSTSWSTLGTKRFLVLAEDEGGYMSVWTPHSISIVDSNATPTASVILPDPTEPDPEVFLQAGFADDDIGAPLNDECTVIRWYEDDPTCSVPGNLIYEEDPANMIDVNNSTPYAYDFGAFGTHQIYLTVQDSYGGWSDCEAHTVFVGTECYDGVDNNDGVGEEPWDTWFDNGDDGGGASTTLADPSCFDYTNTNFIDLLYNPSATPAQILAYYSSSTEYESVNPQCSNGQDDDGDGFVDADDAGCHTNYIAASSTTYSKFLNREETCGVDTNGIVCDPEETFGTCPSDCSADFQFIEF